MQTIYLDEKMVPAALRQGYGGKKFEAQVCTSVTIPIDAGLWDGGSRDQYSVINLADGRTALSPGQNSAPWSGERREYVVELKPGMAVVRHSYFCGKDMGLRFYVHPDNAAALLPPPAAELSPLELLVLRYTAGRKSSYMGRDRYDMAIHDANGGYDMNRDSLTPTRAEWDAAKASLVGRGYLNKAGAITVAGRNAVPSRY